MHREIIEVRNVLTILLWHTVHKVKGLRKLKRTYIVLSGKLGYVPYIMLSIFKTSYQGEEASIGYLSDSFPVWKVKLDSTFHNKTVQLGGDLGWLVPCSFGTTEPRTSQEKADEKESRRVTEAGIPSFSLLLHEQSWLHVSDTPSQMKELRNQLKLFPCKFAQLLQHKERRSVTAFPNTLGKC